jgi:transposase
VAGDEATLYLQATLTRIWYPRGQTPVIRVSPNRQAIHFYGALNLRTGQVTVMRSSLMNSAATEGFLLQLLATYPTQRIVLLWDRATWHRSKLLRTFVGKHTRLEILWLPPASPDLNPQEHVWKAARLAVSHNHALTKFAQLADAFEAFLTNTTFPCSLLSLHNFQHLCMMFK